jgi:RNA polymerase sigma-70 factor (ECF subfamily)
MPVTDAELLQQMQQGDGAAFSTLYRRHQPRIFRFVTMFSGSEVVAADVTQEVFMQLIDNQRFDPSQGDLGAYLLGIARNLLRRLHRDTHRFEALEENDETLHTALIDWRDPALLVSRAQQQGGLRAAILNLPAYFREVVVLCELEELDYQAAAAALDIPIGTVRSRLSRARKALIAALELTACDPHADLERGKVYELHAI